MTSRGGVIDPDNRPVKAPGVGKNSNRSDLAREIPPVLGSKGITQGDVQALEQGERIAPKQRNPVAGGQPQGQPQGQSRLPQSAEIPDAIEFMGGRSTGPLGTPEVIDRGGSLSKAATWLPIMRRMVAGPGSSGKLASALIKQMRALNESPRGQVAVVDLQAVDAGLEAMLDEGI